MHFPICCQQKPHNLLMISNSSLIVRVILTMAGHSSSASTRGYHLVDNSGPGTMVGYFSYITRPFVHDYYYGTNHSIFIRAVIGVFLDHQQLPPIANSSLERHRCVIFQVGDKCFYEFESVIATRCPPLLSDYPQSNHTVVISDVDPDVFKAVLWFLNYKCIHPTDVQVLAGFNDGSFALKMLAAADKYFKLKDLRTELLGLFLTLCKLPVLYRYFEIEHTAKELWRKVSSSLPQKMKEA